MVWKRKEASIIHRMYYLIIIHLPIAAGFLLSDQATPETHQQDGYLNAGGTLY